MFCFFVNLFTLLMITYRPSTLFKIYDHNDDRERNGRGDGNKGLETHTRLEPGYFLFYSNLFY